MTPSSRPAANPVQFKKGILAQLNLQLDRAKESALDAHHPEAADKIKQLAQWRSLIEGWNGSKTARLMLVTSKRAPRLVARAFAAAVAADERRAEESARIFGERQRSA